MINKCVMVLLMMAVVVTLVPTQVDAQGEPMRRPNGQPDISGTFTFRTLTPFQRPEQFAEQETLNAETAAEFEASERTRQNRDLFDPVEGARSAGYQPRSEGGVLSYNEFWYERGVDLTDDKRTSLVIDPPNGRLPARVPRTEPREQLSLDERNALRYESYTSRSMFDRCIMGFNSGPPMSSGAYNNNVMIFQTSDHVVILNEMVHDARIVPLDGRSQLSEGMRQWMGSSRGRWEGDTLVVETANFTDQTASFSPSVRSSVGSGATLHLTERFRRVDDDTLLYEFTVNDPSSFERPFTAALPMKRGAAPMFEYACHEGNYGMLNLLTGARMEELADTSQP